MAGHDDFQSFSASVAIGQKGGESLIDKVASACGRLAASGWAELLAPSSSPMGPGAR